MENTKNSYQVIQPSLDFKTFKQIINNEETDILTRALIKFQWFGTFRINEIVQLWKHMYDLRQIQNIKKDMFKDIPWEYMNLFLSKKINIKSNQENTQYFELMMEVMKRFTDNQLQEMYEVFGSTKPLSIKSVSTRYKKLGLQTHSVRRGAANHLWITVNEKGLPDGLLIVKSALRHQQITSTMKYIEGLENAHRECKVNELMKELSDEL